MPAVKTYTRVNFQNYPSTSTPLNATNLNKMDKGIDDLDDEVVTVKNAIENMSFDADSISYDNTSSGLQATDVQGAVDEINDNLTELKDKFDLTIQEEKVGTWLGSDMYRKSYAYDGNTITSDYTIDATLTTANSDVVKYECAYYDGEWKSCYLDDGTHKARPCMDSSKLFLRVQTHSLSKFNLSVYYVKKTVQPS